MLETTQTETQTETHSTPVSVPNKSKLKRVKTMSTPNQVGATPAKPEAVTVKKTYRYFDLGTFTEIAENAEVTFVPPADYAEAMSRIGNDSEIVKKAVTAYLQRAAFGEKRKEIASKGASKKIVLGVIKPLRNLPPWSNMEDRKAQTESLLQMVKANSVMVDAIKAASIAAAETDEDEDEGAED
jgi:hypothetical protein